MSYHDIFKLMLVGDTSTGKTTFLTQLMYRVPQRLPKPTTHLSFFTMRISKPPTIIQIWDSSGDPKFYYQMLGSLQKFNAILLFVDITNQYTFQRASMIADQIQLYENIQIHLVQSKIEQVEKDPLKRKVSKKLINKFMKKFKGGIFQYRMNASVQNLIQKVIEWKKQDFKELIVDDEGDRRGQIIFEKQKPPPVCQCRTF